MKHLIIIGAGGFGREIYIAATESLGYKNEFDIKGFIDDNPLALENYHGYPPVLGTIKDYEISDGDVFICAMGSVKSKKICCESILNKGGEFINIVHKQAYIGKNIILGKGCIILALSRIHCDVTVGDFLTLQPYSVLGHDVKVGNWCHINDYTDCGGFSQIGNEVTLHTHSFILPMKKIGNGATVGAGSIVVSDVKDGTTVFGVPAKRLPIPVNK